MKTYPSKRAILAVATIVALIGSASIFTAEAAPIAENLNVNKVSFGLGLETRDRQPAAVAVADNVVRHLAKRAPPAGETTHSDKPTNPPETKNPPATTSAQPKPTSNPNPDPTSTKDPAKPTATTTGAAHTATSATSGGSNTGTSSGGAIPISTTSGAPTTTTSPTAGSGDNGVPTAVSEKVFIGLGTFGGLIVFALGGVAFCRHRRKKNLATALLQQTAQFNNNNPYAKLPEPAATPKESLPMTPTKPLGTYNVVATYTPALADEIEIGLGDSVSILQEFDDGWCMGVNNSRGGAKGVFPRHCVEMGPYEGSQHGAPGGPHYPPSPSFKAAANKRMSSIAPASGWNGGGYPSQPNPQYPGPNQGGGGGGGFYSGEY
ncbi:hypothetical protein BGX26_012681 [Mortierella sp. AD094]|nr:hypothetical protein BGX26_012681 [Mortierella sp. AD094]